MTTWNFRVIKDPIDDSVGIYEVYYNEDGSIWLWSSEPSTVYGNDPEDLKLGFDRMEQAFSRPVLNKEELPGYQPTNNIPAS